MSDPTDAVLAAQYEVYPYPPRDGREEANRLVVGSPGHLREVDHWVFGATRPASVPLRALFAGAGTGDGTIMLAQQMAGAGRPGRVTWLDRSGAALAIARARAEARRLDNIDWEQGSLLDLPGSGLGPFDYIDCCGVLHHLPDPLAGLQALMSVLAPGGGIGLMVYAPHGRTGVYMLQDALRRLAPAAEPPQARVEVAKRVLRHLPQTAWLRHNPVVRDHIVGGDAGIHDLLLNPRDVAFDVKALHELLLRAGLRPVSLVEPMRYDPATWLPDPKLRALAATLGATERAAFAEALTGNMSRHVVYGVRQNDPMVAADPFADDAVPVAREGSAAELVRHIRPDGVMPLLFDGLPASLALPPLAPAILRLVDGSRTVGAIAAALAERGTDPATFARAWRATWSALNPANRLLLAAPSSNHQ